MVKISNLKDPRSEVADVLNGKNFRILKDPRSKLRYFTFEFEPFVILKFHQIKSHELRGDSK